MAEVSKKFMTMSIWVAIVLFAFRCFLGFGNLCMAVTEKEIFECVYSVFGYAGEAVGGTVLLMAGFNKWFWKWKPLNMLAGKMPVLAKKYKGRIRFTIDSQDRELDIEIGIVQTFLNVTVKLGTDESNSNSVTATIKEENGSMMLIYTYLNIPRAEIQNKSAIHYGTAILNVDDPRHITGNYFTTRLSRGSMDFVSVE